MHRFYSLLDLWRSEMDLKIEIQLIQLHKTKKEYNRSDTPLPKKMGGKQTKSTTPKADALRKTADASRKKANASRQKADASRQKQRDVLLSSNTKYIAKVLPHFDLMAAYALDDTAPIHQITGRNFLFVTIPKIIDDYNKTFPNNQIPTFMDGRLVLNEKEMKSYSATIDSFRQFYNDTLSKHEAKFGIFNKQMIEDIKTKQAALKQQTLNSTFPKQLINVQSCKDIEALAITLRNNILKTEIQLRKVQHGLPISQELCRLFPSLFTTTQMNKLKRIQLVSVTKHFENQLTLFRSKVKKLEQKLEIIQPNSKLWKDLCPILVSSVLPWRVGMVEGNMSPLQGEMRCERALKRLSLEGGGKGRGNGDDDNSREHELRIIEYYSEELLLGIKKQEMILKTGCCHHEHGWGEPIPVSAIILEGCRKSGFENKCIEKYRALKDLVEKRKMTMNSSSLDESMRKLEQWHDEMKLVATKSNEKKSGEGKSGEEKSGEEKSGEKKTVTASAPSAPSLPSFDFLDMPEAVGVEVERSNVHDVYDAEGTDFVAASLEAFLPLAPSFPLSGQELEAVLPVAPTNNVVLEEVTTEEERTPTLA